MARSPKRLALAILVAAALSGCAGSAAYREGTDLLSKNQVEQSLVKFQQAVDEAPGNAAYQAAYLRTRDNNANRLLLQADRDLADGKPALAQQNFIRVLTIDPGNERARIGMRAIDADRRHATLLSEAAVATDKQDYDTAKAKLNAILAERPSHEDARLLLAQVMEKSAPPTAETELTAAFRKPISLEFRDAPLKQIFEVIARHSGLNFVFDKDVKADQRTSIFLKNTTVEAAVYFLLVTNQLERQVMDGNTILIYPNVAAKLKEYQEMSVKTFFLANADAKAIGNTLKTILKTRDVVVDEKLNLVIVRDSPEAIKLAGQLIAVQDVPEAEVMLDVEVLEITRTRAMDLGVAWPTTLSFSPLANASGALTINDIKGLNSNSIAVGGVAASITANKTDGDTNTLAHPRIRVRNKEKAKVVIGDKVPNITSTISSGVGGFSTESINYLDVGLTLNVEPTISLNNEVAIRISMEVSNLIDTITSKNGTVAYRIGTRSASTMLQLKDGENQVLAGLINNEERASGSKIPGLGDLPIVGRLFGAGRNQNDRTEIVLSITPHLIRNLQRPTVAASEFGAGTESSFRRRPDMTARGNAVLPGGAVQTGGSVSTSAGGQPGAAGQQRPYQALPVGRPSAPVTPAVVVNPADPAPLPALPLSPDTPPVQAAPNQPQIIAVPVPVTTTPQPQQLQAVPTTQP
jgi:general secretion pathway protein D